MDPGVEEWIRGHVDPLGPIELLHDRPWATVMRVATADHVVWFKACAPVQAFEPRLSAHLFERWPDRVAEVLGHDEDRGWLLLMDAGQPIGVLGNPPESWLNALPLYAELQRGETAQVEDHLLHGVPDLRLPTLPDLPTRGVPETIQHDDLHMGNLYAHRRRLRILDWGDSSIAHAVAWLRQRDALAQDARPDFDKGFSIVLRRALAHMGQP
jgi:hypothetical protein